MGFSVSGWLTEQPTNNHLSRMILRHVSEVLTKSLRLSLVTIIPSVFSARWSRNLVEREREREGGRVIKQSGFSTFKGQKLIPGGTAVGNPPPEEHPLC